MGKSSSMSSLPFPSSVPKKLFVPVIKGVGGESGKDIVVVSQVNSSSSFSSSSSLSSLPSVTPAVNPATTTQESSVVIHASDEKKLNPQEQFEALTNDDYPKIFGMSKDEFLKLPQWRQLNLKKKANMF
jgi:hypothetical protein